MLDCHALLCFTARSPLCIGCMYQELSFTYAFISDDLAVAAFFTSAFLGGTNFTAAFFAAFLAALLDLAQRSFCAAAIRALPSALITRLVGSTATVLITDCVCLGRPGDLF